MKKFLTSIIFFFLPAFCIASGLEDFEKKLGELTTIGKHWKITGEMRGRYELWNWFQTTNVEPNDDNDYGFFAWRFRLGLLFQSNFVDAFVEGQDTRLVDLPDEAVAPAPFGPLGIGAIYFAHNQDKSQGRTFLNQGFLRLKNLPFKGLSIRGGRFEYAEGLEFLYPDDPKMNWLKTLRVSQRLIGTFGWSHVTRSFDGFQLAYDDSRFNLTATATHPTQGAFEIDANDEISDIDLLSITLTGKKSVIIPNAEARLFYIYYRDDRSVPTVDNIPPARKPWIRWGSSNDIGIHTLGGNIIGIYDVLGGKADLVLWGAYQDGDWKHFDHTAGAIGTEVGYQFMTLPWKPWIRLGFFRSSGDDNPGDGDHETFFQILPTPRVYAFVPFYNLMNNEDVFLQLIMKPVEKLLVRLDWHHLSLSEEDDLWYMGGGATQKGGRIFGYIGRPSRRDDDLADSLELSLIYNLTKNLDVQFFYSHAFGNGVIEKIYPRGEDADFGYMEFNFKF